MQITMREVGSHRHDMAPLVQRPASAACGQAFTIGMNGNGSADTQPTYAWSCLMLGLEQGWPCVRAAEERRAPARPPPARPDRQPCGARPGAQPLPSHSPWTPAAAGAGRGACAAGAQPRRGAQHPLPKSGGHRLRRQRGAIGSRAEHARERSPHPATAHGPLQQLGQGGAHAQQEQRPAPPCSWPLAPMHAPPTGRRRPAGAAGRCGRLRDPAPLPMAAPLNSPMHLQGQPHAAQAAAAGAAAGPQGRTGLPAGAPAAACRQAPHAPAQPSLNTWHPPAPGGMGCWTACIAPWGLQSSPVRLPPLPPPPCLQGRTPPPGALAAPAAASIFIPTLSKAAERTRRAWGRCRQLVRSTPGPSRVALPGRPAPASYLLQYQEGPGTNRSRKDGESSTFGCITECCRGYIAHPPWGTPYREAYLHPGWDESEPSRPGWRTTKTAGMHPGWEIQAALAHSCIGSGAVNPLSRRRRWWRCAVLPMNISHAAAKLRAGRFSFSPLDRSRTHFSLRRPLARPLTSPTVIATHPPPHPAGPERWASACTLARCPARAAQLLALLPPPLPPPPLSAVLRNAASF